jgi:hypothetical protein
MAQAESGSVTTPAHQREARAHLTVTAPDADDEDNRRACRTWLCADQIPPPPYSTAVVYDEDSRRTWAHIFITHKRTNAHLIAHDAHTAHLTRLLSSAGQGSEQSALLLFPAEQTIQKKSEESSLSKRRHARHKEWPQRVDGPTPLVGTYSASTQHAGAEGGSLLFSLFHPPSYHPPSYQAPSYQALASTGGT